MDIVLEILDTFIFDRLFAQISPTGSNAHGSLKLTNTTTAGVRELPSTLYNNFHYRPATQYFSLEPSKWAYMTNWQRDDPLRQLISLYLITWIFGAIVYFIFASLSYLLIFDKAMFDHPKYLKNQVWLEIKQTAISLPIMSLFTAPVFWLEVQGYGKLYDTTADGPGLWYNIIQFPFFIAFTDCFIYWIHRGLHIPALYKRLHKPHHKWIVPTPYASHAFHPIDGFAQSVPYHVFPFLFPLQKYAYVVLFVFINIWTILIHDGEYVANSPIVNGAACHTLHHLYFNFNYGQFTTLWDRMCGSYRQPNAELFGKTTKTSHEEWARQTKEMEKAVKKIEGHDDRTYLPDVKTKKVQ